MVDEVIKPNEEKPVSIVEEARAIRDEIIKAKDELKAENERKEKIQSNELLSGTAGGRVEAELVSPEDQKVKGAKDYFKGTLLEKDIKKANEQI